eukprot:CAMPEP_0184869088 /NCGR_PEP_ID=MMETSP0580-20130426/32806_1 /TAXON_ID=1118495 /ORGANISM="Dactyliosolen fragilissimus" /LENGTH=799 /DNA_ID=CAMNT_0027370347 /DNA_START=100 /DNA_END=2499 /DNA_ORIENTATION=-
MICSPKVDCRPFTRLALKDVQTFNVGGGAEDGKKYLRNSERIELVESNQILENDNKSYKSRLVRVTNNEYEVYTTVEIPAFTLTLAPTPEFITQASRDKIHSDIEDVIHSAVYNVDVLLKSIDLAGDKSYNWIGERRVRRHLNRPKRDFGRDETYFGDHPDQLAGRQLVVVPSGPRTVITINGGIATFIEDDFFGAVHPTSDGLLQLLTEAINSNLSAKLNQSGISSTDTNLAFLKDITYASATPVPSPQPTLPPSSNPTQIPTKIPTEVPTKTPTEVPTKIPTKAPSRAPTQVPTQIPVSTQTTLEPSSSPIGIQIPPPITDHPSYEPTFQPSTTADDKITSLLNRQDGEEGLKSGGSSNALPAVVASVVCMSLVIAGFAYTRHRRKLSSSREFSRPFPVDDSDLSYAPSVKNGKIATLDAQQNYDMNSASMGYGDIVAIDNLQIAEPQAENGKNNKSWLVRSLSNFSNNSSQWYSRNGSVDSKKAGLSDSQQKNAVKSGDENSLSYSSSSGEQPSPFSLSSHKEAIQVRDNSFGPSVAWSDSSSEWGTSEGSEGDSNNNNILPPLSPGSNSSSYEAALKEESFEITRSKMIGSAVIGKDVLLDDSTPVSENSGSNSQPELSGRFNWMTQWAMKQPSFNSKNTSKFHKQDVQNSNRKGGGSYENDGDCALAPSDFSAASMIPRVLSSTSQHDNIRGRSKTTAISSTENQNLVPPNISRSRSRSTSFPRSSRPHSLRRSTSAASSKSRGSSVSGDFDIGDPDTYWDPNDNDDDGDLASIDGVPFSYEQNATDAERHTFT